MDKMRRSPAISSPKTKFANVAKKKALRPNPEIGKAVAVPRLSGQLNVAASIRQLSTIKRISLRSCLQVFIADVKDVQLPRPVRNVQNRIKAIGTESGPQTYA